MTHCDECGGVSHQRWCSRAVEGLAIGRKRKRTPAEQESYDRTKGSLLPLCGCCGRRGDLTPHHIVPQQRAAALGWTQAQIDAPSNLVGLCVRCHGFEGGTDAQRNILRRKGLLKDE